MWFFEILFKKLFTFPLFLYYIIFDKLIYKWYHHKRIFPGWGIHLYTGHFGASKTMLMVIRAYKLCKKYPQLSVVTNIRLMNFPETTQILPLNTAEDILNAPNNSLILIDEIGTLFNSRDFSSGQRAVPKPVFQHLCQCRKRRLMILATVQRFNLLDKQIRDITATVTDCASSFAHPFSRWSTGLVYDIDEYEASCSNPLYKPRVSGTLCYVQKDKYRHLYDTTQLIQGLLTMQYLSDEEILRNQGNFDSFPDGSKEAQKAFRKARRRKR